MNESWKVPYAVGVDGYPNKSLPHCDVAAASVVPLPESSSSDTTARGDEEYFRSYSNLDTHHLMVFDEARTRTYRDAIMNNKHLFTDKIVLDVGAGTGILSFFAAEAGARHVYAVEACPELSALAEAVVRHNSKHEQITVVHGRVEDVHLPVDQVDVIISEWMGFYLLHESMLSSVITARDRFLRSGGVLFPDVAELYVCPSSVDSFVCDRLSCWRRVYDTCDMKPVADAVRSGWQHQPQVMITHPEELLSEPQLVTRLDLMYVDEEQLRQVRCRKFVTITRSGVYRALCLWFRCLFTCGGAGDEFVLDTSPQCAETHWKHTAVVLPRDFSVEKEEVIGFEVLLTRRAFLSPPSSSGSADNEFGKRKRSSEEARGERASSCRQYVITVDMLDEDDEHPVPCNCSFGKCRLIKALMDKERDEMLES